MVKWLPSLQALAPSKRSSKTTPLVALLSFVPSPTVPLSLSLSLSL